MAVFVKLFCKFSRSCIASPTMTGISDNSSPDRSAAAQPPKKRPHVESSSRKAGAASLGNNPQSTSHGTSYVFHWLSQHLTELCIGGKLSISSSGADGTTTPSSTVVSMDVYVFTITYISELSKQYLFINVIVINHGASFRI